MSRQRQAYQFKVTLKGVAPPVWRRIQVPATYSFWDLHVAIQDAMGWLDYHLHAFRIPHADSKEALEIGIPDEDAFGDDPDFLPGCEFPVARHFLVPGESCLYTYDFGDDWEHEIVFEQAVPREKGGKYPRCIAGEQACPPEDCGGPWGYEEFLDAIDDPEHEEHESMLRWVGGKFDAEVFDPRRVRFDSPRARWRLAFLGEGAD